MERTNNFTFDPSKMSKVAAEEYSSSDSDADDDDEYLIPSTNPNANEFADYNPRKRRRTGRDAKESAALGIFGSESEDEGPPRKWKGKTLRAKGMSFVSSEKPDPDSEEHDSDVDDEDDIVNFNTMRARDIENEGEDEEEEAAGGVGLGFSASASQGLGFAPPTQRQLFTPAAGLGQNSTAKGPFDGGNPLGRGFVPSSASEPVLIERSESAPKPQAAHPSAFSANKGKGGKAKINFKSFGARMMAKMGYVAGEGLGKEGQGRNVIIEANVRPQGIGLGAVKEKSELEKQEEKRQAKLRGETIVDSDEEEKKRKIARRRKAVAGGTASGAPSSGASTPKRQKPKYMTMDEVRKAAPGLNIPDAFTPILDMTGPGKKLLTSSSGLMTPTNGTPGESVEHNESRKLARRAQNDFMAILEEWQSLQNRKAYTELQMQQEKQELEEMESGLQGQQSMANSFAELSLMETSDQWEERWNQAIARLKSAVEAIPKETLAVLKDELGAIAVAALHPMFKQAMHSWDPLESPNPPIASDLKSIHNLLSMHETAKHHRKSAASPYETMMYKIWLPRVSRAIREWNVRDCDQLLSLYEAWRPLLPGFVRTQLLEQDIVRKLDDAVAKWEPKRRKNYGLPHLWLFPWLPYLPPHHLDPKGSNGLVAEVKRKFRQLIDVWEFYKGVIPGLAQWKDVLKPSPDVDQWRPLVMNHVLPSMSRYVRAQFQIDPKDQEPYLEVITGEFQWLQIGSISPTMIGEVMVAEVFPMWHEALYRMLVSEDADYDEIVQWYCWWVEEVFPEELLSLPSVAAEFEKAIVMINMALDLGSNARLELGPPQKGPALQTSKTSHRDGHHRHHHREHKPQPAQQTRSGPEPEEMSIRSFVEGWCEKNDLQFIPERKKVHAQGPLYRITARGDGRGGILIYFKEPHLYAETKKGPLEVSVGREGDWALLLSLAQ